MRLTETDAAKLSYHCRRAHKSGTSALITSDILEQVVDEGSLPSPAERLNNLVLELGDRNPDGGDFTEIDAFDFQAIIGASTQGGVSFIARHAVLLGLAEERQGVHGVQSWTTCLRLTMSGWVRYEELKRSGGIGSVAFIAMKFGDTELDRLLTDFLRPSVSQTGFTVRRLDDQPRAGLIDDRLRVEIRACRFLLADLTHANHGAYWEAGFAEGLGKPVIYLCKHSIFNDHQTRPHFDTNHHTTVLWELATAAQDMETLKATIRYSIPEAKQTDD